MREVFAVAMLGFILTGCGGNTKTLSCADSDWDQVGYDTAMAGKSVRTFEEYKKQCGESLETVAKQQYLDGYTRGVIEYCTFDNGFKLGSNNIQMPEVCPYEHRKNFVEGYNAGQFELAEKKRRLDELEEQSLRNAGRENMEGIYNAGVKARNGG